MISTHNINSDGWVTGGRTDSLGLAIDWQNGPLPQNGATVEDVIEAAVTRLQQFQDNKNSRNAYNEAAIKHLKFALQNLNERTAERRKRGVEGKYEP